MTLHNIQDIGFAEPSTLTFEVGQAPATHQEWSRQLGELPLAEVFDTDLAQHALPVPRPEDGYTMARRADHSISRDWWAPDHLWHIDGTRWPVQPVLTGIVCQEAAPGAPKTEFLDMVGLTAHAEREGFWQAHGIENPADTTTVFADSTYYREALSYMHEHASAGDKALIGQRAADDIAKSLSADVAEHALAVDTKFPPKLFPLMRQTWLHGLKTLFIEGGGRQSHLLHDNHDQTEVLHAFRHTYLRGEIAHELGFVRQIGWAANQGVLFPQIGVLHRAQPGNEHNRTLHLGFLVEATQVRQAA